MCDVMTTGPGPSVPAEPSSPTPPGLEHVTAPPLPSGCMGNTGWDAAQVSYANDRVATLVNTLGRGLQQLQGTGLEVGGPNEPLSRSLAQGLAQLQAMGLNVGGANGAPTPPPGTEDLWQHLTPYLQHAGIAWTTSGPGGMQVDRAAMHQSSGPNFAYAAAQVPQIPLAPVTDTGSLLANLEHITSVRREHLGTLEQAYAADVASGQATSKDLAALELQRTLVRDLDELRIGLQHQGSQLDSETANEVLQLAIDATDRGRIGPEAVSLFAGINARDMGLPPQHIQLVEQTAEVIADIDRAIEAKAREIADAIRSGGSDVRLQMKIRGLMSDRLMLHTALGNNFLLAARDPMAARAHLEEGLRWAPNADAMAVRISDVPVPQSY